MTSIPSTRTCRVLVALLVVLILPALPVTAAQAASPRAAWLALGDSYSSGEGQAETSQERDAQYRDCARATGQLNPSTENATKAWPAIAFDKVKDKGRFAEQDFVACTGTITDAWREQIAEATHRSKRTSWDVVSLSFGGNNIKFAEILEGCLDLANLPWGAFDLSPGCDITLNEIDRRITGLASKSNPAPSAGTVTLPELYDNIAEHVRPGGQVIVAGYPQFVEEVDLRSAWPKFGPCDWIWGHDVDMLRTATAHLNDAIRKAVRDAGARWAEEQVTFTYADFANEVYETKKEGRHPTCTGDPWINGLSTGVTAGDIQLERSFHPNRDGHQASGEYVAGLVLPRIRNGQPAPQNDLRNRFDWRISTDGLGPMRLGITGPEGIALGVAEKRGPSETCPPEDFPYQQSVRFAGTADGTDSPRVLSRWGDRLEGIFVRSPNFPTLSGLRVGDPFERVTEVLGSRAVATTDRSDGSRVLVVRGGRNRYVEFLPANGRVYAIAVGTGQPANSGIDYC